MKTTILAGLAAILAVALTFGTTSVQAEKSAKKSIINDKCPISDRGINKSKTTDVKVGFCCGNCLGKFTKAPGKHLKKVAAGKEGKCPFSGKDANPSKTATITVGFCCGNCKGKYDKDPLKNLAKVKVAKKGKKKA